jgi:hypothetical protein
MTGLLASGAIFSSTGIFPLVEHWDDRSDQAQFARDRPAIIRHKFLESKFFLVVAREPVAIEYAGLVLRIRPDKKYERIRRFRIRDDEEEMMSLYRMVALAKFLPCSSRCSRRVRYITAARVCRNVVLLCNEWVCLFAGIFASVERCIRPSTPVIGDLDSTR